MDIFTRVKNAQRVEAFLNIQQILLWAASDQQERKRRRS